MTPAKQVEVIAYIIDIHELQINSEDPDLFPNLPDDEGYVLEAITAIVNGWPESPVVRMFLEA